MNTRLEIIIERDNDSVPGQFRVIGIKRLNCWERMCHWLWRTLHPASAAPLPRFSSGLSVGVLMTTNDYATLMSMTAVPSHAQGHATLDLIPTPQPTQGVGDQGIRI